MSQLRARRITAGLILGGLLLGGVLAVAPSAGQETSLSIRGSQSIPTQALTIDGTEYTTDSLRTADPGSSITVEAGTGSDEPYRIYIYNTDEQIVDQKRGTGSTTATFDLSGYEPGSYLVTISLDGDTKAIHPLLLRGYDVSTTAPNQADRGGRIDVEAEAEYLRGDRLDHVQFIVTNGEDRVRKNATSSNPYSATISFDGLPAGEYHVYAAARGTQTAFGENVFLGLSESQQLTIREPTPTPTDSSDGVDSGDGGSGGGDPGATDSDGGANSTPTATAVTTTPTATTPTVTVTPTATPTATTPTVTVTPTATTPTVTVTPTATTPTPTAPNTTTPTPTESSVVTPVSASQTDTTGAATDGQPGFGVAATLAALAGVLVIVRQWQN
jgi:PGF-CTERM protein